MNELGEEKMEATYSGSNTEEFCSVSGIGWGCWVVSTHLQGLGVEPKKT